MSEFVKVAELGDVPTDTGLVVEVGREEIALFRLGDEVFAIDNMCPHMGAPIGGGWLEGEVVVCPFHAWEVNVRTGQVVFYPTMCTKTFPCKVEDGAVWVEV